MKSDEIFSLTAVVSVVSFAACWLVPLHFYLQLYLFIIDLLVRSPFGSYFLNIASKFVAKYLSGFLEIRDNFPIDAIITLRFICSITNS